MPVTIDHFLALCQHIYELLNKKELARAARTSIVDKDTGEYTDPDYETVWRWYIYRHLVTCIRSYKMELFRKDEAFKRFEDCIASPNEEEDNFFVRLIPKLKRGNILLSHEPQFGLEFEWGANDTSVVKFLDLVRRADQLFSALSPGKEKLSIFFDEVELSLGNTKQYNKDILLIRDLVVAIEKFNNVCRQKRINITLYSAIRSEVLYAVNSLGKEINKTISDFGYHILWHRSSVDPSQNPLIKILLKRISFSEQSHSGLIRPDHVLLHEYFSDRIHEKATFKYILDLTWYRPRDIVRLITIAQQQFPDKTQLSQQVLDTIKKQYSTESWTELAEELKARYTATEVGAMRRMFNGYQKKFSFRDLMDRVDSLMLLYKDVKALADKHDLANVLEDLYRIGLVVNIVKGSYSTITRSSFKGDDEILLERQIGVHEALFPFFTING